ncbi:MAG: hypothetical protein GY777_24525 [Candidatus Brocadiaceae bacterium]|nr:hypothetical protein [Candidatus Brocadiaceae bacterium]
MANKIIDKNKLNKEPENNQISQDRGVGSRKELIIKIKDLTLFLFIFI